MQESPSGDFNQNVVGSYSIFYVKESPCEVLVSSEDFAPRARAAENPRRAAAGTDARAGRASRLTANSELRRTRTVCLGCADFFERNFRLRISSRPSLESSRAEASNEPSSACRRAHSAQFCPPHGMQVARSSLHKLVVRCSSRGLKLV